VAAGGALPKFSSCRIKSTVEGNKDKVVFIKNVTKTVGKTFAKLFSANKKLVMQTCKLAPEPVVVSTNQET
jgi:hypothetical protein